MQLRPHKLTRNAHIYNAVGTKHMHVYRWDTYEGRAYIIEWWHPRHVGHIYVVSLHWKGHTQRV